MNALKRIEKLEAEIKRLRQRTTVGGGGTPPSQHAATHESGGTDPITITLPDIADEQLFGRAVGAGTGALGELTPDEASAVLDLATDPFARTSAVGAGSGDSTHTAAHASRPAASNAGDMFLPTNGFSIERDTGAAWVPWGPLFPCTAPVDGDFAWINQGDASVSTTNGGIFLSAPSNGSHNVRVRKKSAPATPYTVTAMFLPRLLDVVVAAGLCFRQSSDGKLHTFGVAYGGVTLFASQKHTSPTSFSANYTTVAVRETGSPLFLRIADDGSNRICSWSMDGQNWIALHTVGRTDFLTADEVGFFITPSTTVVSAMTLISWKEA